MAHNKKDDSLVINDDRVNVSVSSSSSNDSQGFASQKKSKSSLFKQGSKLKLHKKNQQKWKKNKIGKGDFCNKTTEFRCWLKEKKQMELDELDSRVAKKMFKKFAKRWNSKKLDKKYYENLGVWTSASPSVYSKMSAPEVSEEKAREKVKAETFTPLYNQDFSTFGKRAGKKALRELQSMEGGTPTRSEDPIYAVPSHQSFRDEDINPPDYDTPIKPRPALATLFNQPLMTNGESDNSESEHSFASVRRQRPLSCHGRVQKIVREPMVPIVPSINKEIDNSHLVEMRCPTSRPPRPHTEFPGSSGTMSGLRTKVRSTVSTSSTDSESSSTGSFSSSVSSLSSYAPSTASDADYASSFGSRTSLSRPKPPPRSSSISRHSKTLREVAKAVMAKQSASPVKPQTPLNQRRMAFRSGISACQDSTPSPPPPPPPPPPGSPPGGDKDDILPPPPEFASIDLTLKSPPLPPPPTFLLEKEMKESSTSESESENKPQVPPKAPDQPPSQIQTKTLSFPQASTPQAPLLARSKVRPPTAPKPVQDSAVTEILPSPIVITRHRLTTPAPAPKSGPSLSLISTGQKPEKRPSEESVDLGVTPPKRIDLDISYKCTSV